MRIPHLLLAGLIGLSIAGCTNREAEQTEQAAENAGGTVAQTGENAAVGTGNAAENAGEAAGNTAENVGETVGNAAENTVETASNAGVTAKIKNDILISTDLKPLVNDVNVDATDTQVILKGHVHSQQQVQELESIAKSHAGARTVVNQVTVMQH